MEQSFVDLLIRIGAAPGDGRPHPVEAVIDGRSHFFGGFLQLDFTALVAQSLDVDAYGGFLSEALFSPPIQRAYEHARARAELVCEGRLRLRLQIDPTAAGLQAARWERLVLRHKGGEVPASTAMAMPFSRYTALEVNAPPPLAERPVRMLIAVSNPVGLEEWNLPPVDPEQEVASLWDGLAPLADPATLFVRVLPGRSGLSPALTRILESRGAKVLPGTCGIDTLSDLMRQFHVVHLIAHGAFRPDTQGGAGRTRLLLEAEDGSPHLVADDELVSRWSAAEPLPRLVYLAACESATRGDTTTHTLVGLGPKLVAAGVPAVVAMQDQVPMELSTALTRRFFRSLLAHGVVDQALNEARWLLYEAGSCDWSIPVLYMRLDEGRLLAPDPLREALHAMADWGRECLKLAEAPLPIEAIPVPGTADAAMLRQLERAEEAGFEVGQAARELLLAEAPQVQPFVVLAGGDGAGKTYHLRELVRQVAEDSLGGHTGRTFLPLLLDLATHLGDRSGAALAHGAGVERLLFDALGRFWTGLEPLRFRELWQSPDGPTLVVLIHNINILADAERATLFRELAELAARERRHRFLVACNPSWLHQERGAELPVSEYLVVKRLSFQRVTGYLSALPDTAGQVLLTALEKRRLYDLAGLPWLLVHMLNRTRLGDPPRSRMGVLAGFVGGALADLPSGGAVRGRARESLRALAYALQMVRCRTLPLERVLEILESVRGMREYRLIDMLESLVESRLLVLVGQDGVQFSYPALQAYCCADAMLAAPDSNALLEDIAATLGWLSRLRWWADTLVLLAGMTDAIEVLVGFILHGAGAGQEERVFLAARCIEENGAVDSSSPLFEQTVTALLYLANADYEPRQRVRTRAVHAIQRLQVRSAIPHLVRIAIEPVRTNWIGRRAEEYSGVRLAAMMALRSMGDATLQYVGDRLPVLAELLRRWIAGDASAIERHLSHGDDRVRPVAAFLLGLLRRPEADDHLIALFRSPDQGQLVSWAVTDALTLVDPARVAKEVILPFVDPATGVPVDLPGESQRPRRDRRRQLAYLIGKMKPRDTWAERYLDHCIESLPDIALKGYAVRAFGDRLDTRAKPLLERLALGDFSGIASDASWSDEDRLWLRQESVEALAQVGDSETVRRLRSEWPGSPVTATDAQPQSESAQRLKQEARRKLELNLELARFRTSEEIASRAWEADLDVGD